MCPNAFAVFAIQIVATVLNISTCPIFALHTTTAITVMHTTWFVVWRTIASWCVFTVTGQFIIATAMSTTLTLICMITVIRWLSDVMTTSILSTLWSVTTVVRRFAVIARSTRHLATTFWWGIFVTCSLRRTTTLGTVTVFGLHKSNTCIHYIEDRQIYSTLSIIKRQPTSLWS